MLPPCPRQVGTGEVVSSPSASSRTVPLAFLDPRPSFLVVLRLASFEKQTRTWHSWGRNSRLSPGVPVISQQSQAPGLCAG